MENVMKLSNGEITHEQGLGGDQNVLSLITKKGSIVIVITKSGLIRIQKSKEDTFIKVIDCY